MPDGLLLLIAVAGLAGLASPAAGLISILRNPTTLFLSSSLGFASGVLIATITLEIIPQSMQQGPLGAAVLGFVAGIAAIYGLDLYVHRGKIVGEAAEQYIELERAHRRRRYRGDTISVLAIGTTVEEMIEGLTIGVSIGFETRTAVLIGAAIAFDNLGEGLSIGALIRASGDTRRGQVRRIVLWTSVIGVSVFGSAVLSFLVLQNIPAWVTAFLLAFGGAGMLYLTLTSLIPSGQKYHYQQSSALTAAAGFLLILVLTDLL